MVNRPEICFAHFFNPETPGTLYLVGVKYFNFHWAVPVQWHIFKSGSRWQHQAIRAFIEKLSGGVMVKFPELPQICQSCFIMFIIWGWVKTDYSICHIWENKGPLSSFFGGTYGIRVLTTIFRLKSAAPFLCQGIQESKCFCCTSNHVHPAPKRKWRGCNGTMTKNIQYVLYWKNKSEANMD